VSNYKRHIDDIDGMLDDIAEQLHNTSKSELIEIVMNYTYGDKATNEDIISDYKAYYGEIYE
jgi:hypothetical protein